MVGCASFCLFACNKDEQQEGTDGTPVSFVTTISPSSRLTVNNSWAGLSDAKVGVEINGTVKEYTVNEKGELTSAAPFTGKTLDRLCRSMPGILTMRGRSRRQW